MDTPTKRCSKCGEYKPATPEFFHCDKQIKCGIKARCKSCVKLCKPDRETAREYARRYRAKNPDKVLESTRRYRDKNDGLIKERAHATYYANIDKFRTRARNWRRAHSATINEKNRRSYTNDPIPYRERSLNYLSVNRNKVRENQRKHRRANLEKDRIKSQHRRAQKRGAEGKYTKTDIEHKYKAQKAKCYYCGVSIKEGYHIDHVVPLVRGGSNWPDNLVLACVHCNTSKNDKLPHEWPEGGRLL